MLVPSTCKAVTQVLSTVSCALGVHAPAGFCALQVTGLVVALSVVAPDGSVVAVALAWVVVGNVVAMNGLAAPVESAGVGVVCPAGGLPELVVFLWYATVAVNTAAAPPLAA